MRAENYNLNLVSDGDIFLGTDENGRTKNFTPESVSEYVLDKLGVTGSVVEDQIVDGVIDKAPSQNAVYDALVLKEDVSNKSTSIVTDAASNTKYPSVKSVYDWVLVQLSSLSNLLPLNNIWTGTNRFNKQVKIVSDGTNSPLVVRNSTDTSELLRVETNGRIVSGYSGALGTNFGHAFASPHLGSTDNAFIVGANNFTQAFLNIRNDGTFEIGKLLGPTFQFGHNGLGFYTYGGRGLYIGNDVSTTNWSPSAKLQIDSTTQGVLLPRLTTTQRNAISTPATGLLVDNLTTNQLERWNGTAWVGVGANVQNYFYRRAGSIGANAMIISSLNNNQLSNTDIGYEIPPNSIVESVVITFGYITSASAIVVPIELRIQNDFSATQPGVTTGSLLALNNCNVGAGTTIYNHVSTFTLNTDVSTQAGKYLTLNTGNFTLSGATIEDCLVTIKFRNK